MLQFLQCAPSVQCFAGLAGFQLFMNSMRYFPIAGLVFLILWVWKKGYFQKYRIQDRVPPPERIWFEVRSSFITLLVFVVQGTTIGIMARYGYTKLYFDPHKYGLWYLPVAFVILSLWQETFFYWAHRAMHSRLLFKYVHLVHHRSTNPSPFAAYSFHWSEAILEAAYLTIFVFVLPLHPLVIITQATYAMLMNVAWHSGHEFFPKGWASGRLTRWFGTSTHHNMHHSHVNCNYGLYLNFWDRICGTNHARYEAYFDHVVAKREGLVAPAPERNTELSPIGITARLPLAGK